MENLYSRKFCRGLVARLGAFAMETTPKTRTRGYAARVNDRLAIEDEDAARALWTRLSPVLATVPEFAGARRLSSNMRVYRYTAGHHFGRHVDEAVWTNGGRTQWTVLLYLTGKAEGLVGGETVFYDGSDNGNDGVVSVAPRAGMVCLHKHGSECLEHEALAVDSGEKWVLRTDVVF